MLQKTKRIISFILFLVVFVASSYTLSIGGNNEVKTDYSLAIQSLKDEIEAKQQPNFFINQENKKNEYDHLIKNSPSLTTKPVQTADNRFSKNKKLLYGIIFIAIAVIVMFGSGSFVDWIFKIIEKKSPKLNKKPIHFLALWVGFVLLYVYFFEPYGGFGRLNDDEIKHLIGVIVMPPLVIGLSYYLWKMR